MTRNQGNKTSTTAKDAPQLINVVTSPRHGVPRIGLGQFICRDGENPRLVWVRDRAGVRTYLGTPFGPLVDASKPAQLSVFDGMAIGAG
jgi:hypothetical protein